MQLVENRRESERTVAVVGRPWQRNGRTSRRAMSIYLACTQAN